MKRLLQYALVVVAMAAAAWLAGLGPPATLAQECTGIHCPGNPDCPDDDGDGICNGRDSDYVPCADCTGNPDCPDDDGDGICNGKDPDYFAAHRQGWFQQMLGRLLGFVPRFARF